MRNNRKQHIIICALILVVIIGKYALRNHSGESSDGNPLPTATQSDLPKIQEEVPESSETIALSLYAKHDGWLESSAAPGEVGQCIFAPEIAPDGLRTLGLGECVRVVDASGSAHDYHVRHAETISADASMTYTPADDKSLIVMSDHPTETGKKYVLYGYMRGLE